MYELYIHIHILYFMGCYCGKMSRSLYTETVVVAGMMYVGMCLSESV